MRTASVRCYEGSFAGQSEMIKLIIAAVVFFVSSSAFSGVTCTPDRDKNGKIKRSSYQVKKFKKIHPCPVTLKSTGSCKGYVVDHIKPLCACGEDRPENMQWQTLAESKKKDILERRMCRGVGDD